MLSIMAYMRYITPPILPLDKGRREEGLKGVRGKWYFTSLGFLILALLSKPMAISLPVVLLVLDWHPFERIPSFKALRTAIVEKLPFIALSIVSSILTVLAQRAAGAVVSMEYAPLSTRILVGMRSLVAYLWKMVLPLDLVPFYPYPKDASLFSLEYLSAVILVGGITAACIVLAKRQKLWLSVWGYYVITLLPVLGIVQVGLQSMADRYMYLPGLGPFLVIGLMSAWIWARIQRPDKQGLIARSLTVAAALLVFISLSYLTFKQIGIWKNSIVLWSYVIEKEPERVPVAYYNRGTTFERMGMPDRAIADYDKAIAIKPSYYDAYNNRGLAFEKMGLLDKAIADYDRAIALKPSYYEAFNNRGLAFQKMGLLDNAVKDLEMAMTLKQSSSAAYDNLGKIYGKTGRFDRAIEEFNRAIAMDPLYHEAYYNRAIVYEKMGQTDAAIESYNKAIALNPAYYEAYNNLGVLYGNAGLYDKAIEHFTRSIHLNQGQAVVYLNRGTLYFRTGNKELAVSDFRKACDLGNKAGCSALDALGR
jgi:tetratricopeptide (TPR) repeat protein